MASLSYYYIQSIQCLSFTGQAIYNQPYFCRLSAILPYRHVSFNLSNHGCPVISVHTQYIMSVVLIVSILFLVFYVRLRFRRADNFFYVEENLIKISHVRCKHFPAFSGSSIRADYEYECELAIATSLI